MRIYGIVGESVQTIVDSDTYQPMPNEVLMQTERPTEGSWVASADGTWVEQIPEPPTMEEQLAELDAQYNAEIIRLGNEYNTAQLRGDIDIQSALKDEMSSLDSWFDEEYEKIVGGGK